MFRILAGAFMLAFLILAFADLARAEADRDLRFGPAHDVKRMWSKAAAKRGAPARGTYAAIAGTYAGGEVVAHPAGCPRTAFCGCGVAQRVFGQIDGAMRALWLAANWFKFPRAAPAAGMVAVRNHHVFAIERVIGPGLVVAYDPNSGGRKTRVHVRSLAGYRVVNPRG